MARRAALPFAHPVSLIATWFGAGLLPKVPGTWGSLAALPFAAVIAWLGGPWALLVASLIACLVGIWAGGRYAEAAQSEDPGAVVIDEVAGQWLTLVPAALDPLLFLLGFLTFRVLDIVKPWPASWCDRALHGGVGIMLDDMVAGLYAGALCALVAYWLEMGLFSPAL
ncbi:MAG: phosphatidylglycerophosphatase A [Kiloniellales bacterium]|nr:phosphatidylglycerophosphatase A [Kiloniellales bacterium]